LNPAEREQYLKRTAEILGIVFPLNYIDRAEALVLRNQNEQLCGGVMLVLEGPFRSVDSIPAAFCATHKPLNSRQDVAEINGLWLAPEMKSPFLSFSFWSLLSRHLVKSGKSNFLFTFDNNNSRMKSLAKWLNPKELYSGKTLLMPGMKSESEETIALVGIDSIKVFLTMLERRGIGTAEPEEKEIISRLATSSRQPEARSF
jgi:hypothetical protein